MSKPSGSSMKLGSMNDTDGNVPAIALAKNPFTGSLVYERQITLLTAQAKTAESAFLRQKGEIDEKRRPPSRTNLRWPKISKLRLAAVSAIGAFAQV